MNYEEGTTVLAIREGDEKVLLVFGEGVYVGDRLRPGAQWPCAQDEYDMIAKVVTAHDDVPIEEHEFVTFYDASVAARPDIPPKKDRETMIANLLAERERPLDERVHDLWRSSNENPCIYLDSGDIVWGFQSWWGPLEGANRRYPESDFKRVVVPVPEGNGRWK